MLHSVATKVRGRTSWRSSERPSSPPGRSTAWRIETGLLDVLGPILASGLEVAYLDDRDA